ncbi:hypothetical protein COLO4_04318 [Corchorus olitorius]|uniref:Endonuclease/exonuclease/phosphatase n=1 Tax=Corchorus olitorius TaxID=93759 RepID=A0A1R3KUI4_9ROSI|nr:hypothetical protein COLO4_04318 [Corchorus olitorius]
MDQNHGAVEVNHVGELPPRNRLQQMTLDIIYVLENLLGVSYPIMPPWQNMEATNRTLLNEISRLVIGYHFHTIVGSIPEYEIITTWLGLGPEHIPSLETMILKLQQPYIQSALCSNGLTTFSFPQLNMRTANPTPTAVTLNEPSSNYILDSDEKTVYIFRAANFVQAQLMIYVYHTPISGLLSYHLRFNIGRENSLLQTVTAAHPFHEPADLTAVYYNARGATLLSFRSHLQILVDEHHPMIIIVTETRLGAREANQLASDLRYNQVIFMNPIGYCGGIWLFSDLRSLSLEHIVQGDDQIGVNFLRV